MSGETYTATWYDLYHHLVATGVPMVVAGRLPEVGVDLEWIATPEGLNRYNGAECTATWHPEAGDVLTTPVPIPAAPRSRSHSVGVKNGKRLALLAVARRIGVRDIDNVHPDEPLGFLTYGELRRLVEDAKEEP